MQHLSNALRASAMIQTADLRVQLLGGFHVWAGSEAIADQSWRRKASGLIKLLALAPGHRLAREHVLDRLWPEFEVEAAMNNLHRTLHAARRSLHSPMAPAYLRLEGDAVSLQTPGGLWVDVEAFELACAVAHETRQPAAYGAALELYGGDLLPEDRYEDWVAPRREALRARYVDLLLELAHLQERRAEPWAAIRTLERLAATEPAHEEAHVGLMRLYALNGQRHRAVRQFQVLRHALERELDAEPEPATHRLHAAILDGRFPGQGAAVQPLQAPASSELSLREAEIARLVARGLTNREIAAALGLSGRTAETHVGRTLRKLGLGSRADVGRWALGRGPLVLPFLTLWASDVLSLVQEWAPELALCA
jgi:DNA-binding SARP family transcriptional activator